MNHVNKYNLLNIYNQKVFHDWRIFRRVTSNFRCLESPIHDCPQLQFYIYAVTDLNFFVFVKKSCVYIRNFIKISKINIFLDSLTCKKKSF